MPKFHKTIVKPGVYRIDTPKGRRIKPVTAKYLKQVVENTREMLDAGIKIPGPYAHRDENSEEPGLLIEKDGQYLDAGTNAPQRWNAKINAGFWSGFDVDENGAISGILESPDENIGKTIQATSIRVTPSFTDGLGRTWKNVIQHVALVTDPVEPGQDNFTQLIEEDEYAIAMSLSMANEIGGSPTKEKKPLSTADKKFPASGSNSGQSDKGSDKPGDDSSSRKPEGEDGEDEIEDTPPQNAAGAGQAASLVTLLLDKFQIQLPADTTDQNILERLIVVLTSIPSDEEDDEELLQKKPEKGSEVQSSPVIMSLENKTNKLLDSYVIQRKSQLKSRVSDFIKKGKVGKKYADEVLTPAIDGLTMSLEDMDETTGEFKKDALEMSLDMIDSREGLLEGSEGENKEGDLEEVPGEQEEGMSEEEAKKVYDRIFNYKLN